MHGQPRISNIRCVFHLNPYESAGRVSVKPLDKRLLTYAAAAKKYIIFITIFGTLTAVLVLAQAISISSAISFVI